MALHLRDGPFVGSPQVSPIVFSACHPRKEQESSRSGVPVACSQRTRYAGSVPTWTAWNLSSQGQQREGLAMSGGAVVMHQNRLMRRFRDAGSTSPKSAVALADIGCRNSWVFRRMAARGVFVETGEGRFYMDEDAARLFVEARRRRMLTFLVVAVAICVVWLVFCWLLGRF